MKDVNVLINHGVDVNKSLELFGTMDVYDDTLGDFLAEVDTKLDNLKKYKELNDPANYAIFAHSLKSDARYFGFTKLSEMALAHEMAGKEDNIRFINDNYDLLISEVNNTVSLVKQYLGVNDKVEESVVIINKDKSLLIVDDSNIVINFTTKVFSDTYNIIPARDGEEAIRYLFDMDNLNIVAVLLDLNMPIMNGFEVLEYMRSNNLFKKVGVSIITGAEDQKSIDKAFTYPIVDMLKKPYSEQTVKAVIEKTVKSKEW